MFEDIIAVDIFRNCIAFLLDDGSIFKKIFVVGSPDHLSMLSTRDRWVYGRKGCTERRCGRKKGQQCFVEDHLVSINYCVTFFFNAEDKNEYCNSNQ